MSAVSETIVREYFELHGCFVRQQRKYVAPGKHQDEEIDFFVINPSSRPAAGTSPFVLRSEDLPYLRHAVVSVRGWHTETFTPKLLAKTPELFRFTDPAVFAQAARAFGSDGSLLKILVVPALPSGAEARRQSIDFLREKGIDAVIPFRTMLADLVDHVAANRNYQKSDLLQVIRILKNYDFLRGPQLELFRAKRGRRRGAETGKGEAGKPNAGGR